MCTSGAAAKYLYQEAMLKSKMYAPMVKDPKSAISVTPENNRMETTCKESRIIHNLLTKEPSIHLVLSDAGRQSITTTVGPSSPPKSSYFSRSRSRWVPNFSNNTPRIWIRHSVQQGGSRTITKAYLKL